MWPSSNNNPDVYMSGQWSFNATAYQNIPYEQVDWASLAQQWIRMKETIPVGSGPRPPPPPVLHNVSKSTAGPTVAASISAPSVATSHTQITERIKEYDNVTGERPNYQSGQNENENDVEGGEAPMDMDTKDEDGDDSAGGVASAGWGNWPNQWGWGWSTGNAGTVPLTESNPLTPPSSADSKAYWRDVGYSTAPEISLQPLPSSTAIVGQSWNKNNIAKDNNRSEQKQGVAESFIMDSAKKKKLPAWIREGLTKMERDKQKKLVMEQALQEKYIRDKMRAEELAKELRSSSSSSIYRPLSPSVVKRTEKSTDQSLTVPSVGHDALEKHESSTSSESSSPPLTVAASVGSTPATRPSQHHDPYSRVTRDNVTSRPRLSQPTIRKTKDQIMEESMLKVRRILTQFLLEATENQVQSIAKEEHFRYKSSTSSRAVHKSRALTSLMSGNLGVNVYDSESQSSSDENTEPDEHSGDSDEELKSTIERKMHEFRKIEDEIELEIERREANERSAAMHQRQSDRRDNEHSDNEDNVDDDVNNRDKGASKVDEKENRTLNSELRNEEQQINSCSTRANASSVTNDTERTKNTSKHSTKRKKSSSSSSSSYSSSSSSPSSSSSDSSDSSRQKRRRKRKNLRTNNEKSSDKDSKSKSKRHKSRSRSKSRSPKKSMSKTSSKSRTSDYTRKRRSRSHDRKRHSRSRSSLDSDADSRSSSNSRHRRTTHSPNRRRRRRDSNDKNESKSRNGNKSGNSYSYKRNESDSNRRRRRSRSSSRESRRSRYK